MFAGFAATGLADFFEAAVPFFVDFLLCFFTAFELVPDFWVAGALVDCPDCEGAVCANIAAAASIEVRIIFFMVSFSFCPGCFLPPTVP